MKAILVVALLVTPIALIESCGEKHHLATATQSQTSTAPQRQPSSPSTERPTKAGIEKFVAALKAKEKAKKAAETVERETIERLHLWAAEVHARQEESPAVAGERAGNEIAQAMRNTERKILQGQRETNRELAEAEARGE